MEIDEEMYWDWYWWELLMEQHEHDVVMIESRKESDDEDGRPD